MDKGCMAEDRDIVELDSKVGIVVEDMEHTAMGTQRVVEDTEALGRPQRCFDIYH